MGIKLPDWLTNTNNILGIVGALGISVSGFFAWVIGRLAHLRALDIIILFCVVFVSILWSWIGLIWLSDRIKQPKASKRPLLECPWGIILENYVIRLDPHGDLHCQIAVQIKNTYSFPIRVDLVSRSLSVENLLPDQIIEMPQPFIVMPGPSITFSFPAFSKGRIPEQDRLKGKFEISMRYGHPDGEYSRIMSRWMQFDQQVRPNFPQGLFAGIPMPIMPMANQMPLAAGPYKEDEDKPYIPLKP